MYGQSYYTADRKPPEAFVRRLKELDPLLDAAWHGTKQEWHILRAQSSQFEPYSVVMECAEVHDHGILDAEGRRVAVRQAYELGDRVLKHLRDIDGWAGDREKFIDRIISKPNEEGRQEKEKARKAKSNESAHKMAWALYRDLQIDKPKVAFGIGQFHGKG